MTAYTSTIILVCLSVLSYFVHNSAVTISILILRAIKLTPLAHFFPHRGKAKHPAQYHYSDCGDDGTAANFLTL